MNSDRPKNEADQTENSKSGTSEKKPQVVDRDEEEPGAEVDEKEAASLKGATGKPGASKVEGGADEEVAGDTIEAPAEASVGHDEPAVKQFEIPSTWDGPVGDEPASGESIDTIKSIAVDKKPAAGLQKGEYSTDTYENRQPTKPDEHRLPLTSPDGQALTYQEYDRNPYNGVKRDNERFVVCNEDQTHYYTDDHYKHFTRFR